MYKKSVLFFLLALSAYAGLCQTLRDDLALMPFPSHITVHKGAFRITKDLKIAAEGPAGDRLYSAASRFLRRLDQRTGMFFMQEYITPGIVRGAQVLIRTKRPGNVTLGEDESYELTITPQNIVLSATTDIGALRGLETLLQLLDTDEKGFYFPAVYIKDKPRFPWRGLMIDVSRHFQPVGVIKRNLDGMAAVKMNVLHLHLSDDQGFRIESKIYPALHREASEGKYYTQEEIKEILRYANERGIRVVPEFDVPGHATPWLIAFPELASTPGPYTLKEHAGIFDPTLDPTKEKTYEILGNFFEEMAALFPDEYFHIGGDENEGKHWDENPAIQKFMKKNNITDNHELQAHFTIRIAKLLDSYGKTLIGWDEILHPDLPKKTVIQSWRGPEGIAAAASSGYDVILSNGYYIDLMRPASKHYLNDPLPDTSRLNAEEREHVLGGEATMWSELVTPKTIDSRIWPRTAAIAERLWSPAEKDDVDDMYRRLAIINRQLEEHGLLHITNRAVILRNMANAKDTKTLEILANVAEPMEGYTRNPEGLMYTMYSPFTLFADATIADAPLARKFNLLVQSFLESPDKEKEARILAYLEEWKGVHEKIQEAIPTAPLLKTVEGLACKLSTVAALGLEAMNHKIRKDAKWRKGAQEKFEKAREQGARTELQVVDAIEKLVMAKTSRS